MALSCYPHISAWNIRSSVPSLSDSFGQAPRYWFDCDDLTNVAETEMTLQLPDGSILPS
jgi:hypothetical protein